MTVEKLEADVSIVSTSSDEGLIFVDRIKSESLSVCLSASISP